MAEGVLTRSVSRARAQNAENADCYPEIFPCHVSGFGKGVSNKECQDSFLRIMKIVTLHLEDNTDVLDENQEELLSCALQHKHYVGSSSLHAFKQNTG